MMAKLERNYNVPLRKGFINTPKHKRAKKAVSTLRKFLKKHMKSEEVKLGQHLNKYMWKHGIKNPPHHVKVRAVKDEAGVVRAELEGHEFSEAVRPAEAGEMPAGLQEKMAEAQAKIGAGKDSKEKEDKKEEDKKEKEKNSKKSSKSKKSKSKKSGSKKSKKD